MPQFVHLHVHTQYSILDGQASVQRLVDKAMADGQPGIAVTDHGDMFGIKEFYNYVQKVKGKCKDKAAEAEARIAALRDGFLSAIIVQNAYDQGYKCMENAIRTLVEGKNPEATQQVNCPPVIVTQDNIDSEEIQFMMNPTLAAE